jgi:hypothetical protein
MAPCGGGTRSARSSAGAGRASAGRARVPERAAESPIGDSPEPSIFETPDPASQAVAGSPAVAAQSDLASGSGGPVGSSARPSVTVPAVGPVLTASAAERARSRWTTGGVQFVKIELLGTAPFNRSGMGVAGFHVHEVALSIKNEGFSRRRYRDATVVKVPAADLESFREFNRKMLQSDDLLPAFSPTMRYAMLTKNHLAHALKLFEAGNKQYSGTKETIKPNQKDEALMQHLSDGIHVVGKGGKGMHD